MPLSCESSTFLIEWRPSWLLCGAIRCLGVAAAISLCLSALPFAARIPLALLAFGYGLGQARREALRPRFTLGVTTGPAGLLLVRDHERKLLASPLIRVRGPLASVSGRGEDGRIRRALWWPDTLPAGSRRALRLASGNRIVDAGPALATMSG